MDENLISSPEQSGEDTRSRSIAESFTKDYDSNVVTSKQEGCGCQKRDPNLPHKFWDEDKKQVKLDILIKSYKELEKTLSRLLQEKKHLEGMLDAQEDTHSEYPCCPASVEEYDIQVDHGLFDSDPWINQTLHAAGFSNEQVQLVYDLAEAELMPIAEEIGRRYRMENDQQRLEQHFGGKARWREASRQIRNWAKRNLPDHAYQALSSSYEGILAMHAMIDKKEEPAMLMGEKEKTGLEEKDLRKMMQNPKYWKEHDPTLINKVSDGFKRLYGN